MVDQVEIKAGDVLLFHGNGFVSWGIRKFDGTDVNHAAIALDSTALAEAGGRGLERKPVAEAVGSNKYMKVRRHADPDLAPVVTKATEFVDKGSPYAYQQIVLLALLASTRKIPLDGVAKRMLRSILDHAAAALNAFVDKGGRRSMICSEYVYRAFAETGIEPADRYRVLIQVGDKAFDVSETSLADWAIQQPDETYDAATSLPVSFEAPVDVPAPEMADEIAEQDLAPIMAAWAVENGEVDEDMPAPPPPSFGIDDLEEPSDEELLASLIGFSGALSAANSDEPVSFGLGAVITAAAARGAIQGLLKPAIEANLVTPGDLLLSPTLADVGTVKGGS